MKKMLVGVLTGVWVLSTSVVQAQTKTPSSESWQTVFFGSPGIAIPLLTTAVLRHSAQLKGLELAKQINQQSIQIAKRNILDGVSAGGTYAYGNQGSIGAPTGTVGSPVIGGSQFNTFNSSRYSLGVSVALPLGQALNRKNLITTEKLNLERSETARQDREDQLRQVVIQAYQNVALARKLLTLQQDAYVNVQSTYRLTEKQFRQGQLSLPEFAIANAQVTESAVAQETARNQYETAVLLLEELAGTKLSTLIASQ